MTEMVMVQIISAECQSIKESDLSERIRQCMRLAYGHWMTTEEEVQFKGALAGAMLLSDEKDTELIVDSLKPLKALSALMSGVPVDMTRVLEDVDLDKVIPLRKLWDDVKKEDRDATRNKTPV